LLKQESPQGAEKEIARLYPDATPSAIRDRCAQFCAPLPAPTDNASERRMKVGMTANPDMATICEDQRR